MRNIILECLVVREIPDRVRVLGLDRRAQLGQNEIVELRRLGRRRLDVVAAAAEDLVVGGKREEPADREEEQVDKDQEGASQAPGGPRPDDLGRPAGHQAGDVAAEIERHDQQDDLRDQSERDRVVQLAGELEQTIDRRADRHQQNEADEAPDGGEAGARHRSRILCFVHR
ncbi:hypothetical protein VP06_01415 [Methylobacterium aquaticum]|uniref:Uncharacterized protein n=1 Tax=Methylobacterium aquaticum TaxID=270351 RepID=A0A0J6T563_9HYPH|nr:hypothetical protein VP06_01415 [Methylobacterium aquaticum]